MRGFSCGDICYSKITRSFSIVCFSHKRALGLNKQVNSEFMVSELPDGISTWNIFLLGLLSCTVSNSEWSWLFWFIKILQLFRGCLSLLPEYLFSGQHKFPTRHVYLYFRSIVHCIENEILTEKNVGNNNCFVTENVWPYKSEKKSCVLRKKMKHSCLKFGLDKVQDRTMTEGRMEI